MKKTKFEEGKKYYCSSPLNSECVYEFEIVKRTEKMLVIKDSDGNMKRRKIDIRDEEEIIYPNGKYSMCLVLGSNELVTEEKTQNIVKENIETQYVAKKESNITYVDFEKKEEKKQDNIKYYEINEEMAAREKSMRSFDDYKKGSATMQYRELVDKAADIAEKQKKEVDSIYHKKIDYYFDLYARKLAENLNKNYEIGTRCPSVMVVGAGNFPVRKKEKQINAWDKNMQEYQEIQKILEKIKGIGTSGISSDDPRAIQKLKEKLLHLEEEQENMKAVNAYYKKNKTLEGCNVLTEKIKKILTDYMKRQNITKPYSSFALSNNSANIKRVKQRIEELEQKATDTTLTGWIFDNGRIIANRQLNCLQILFDEKPDEELRTKLKRNGFRWSPSQGVWQRLLNRNVIYAAEQIKELQKI